MVLLGMSEFSKKHLTLFGCHKLWSGGKQLLAPGLAVSGQQGVVWACGKSNGQWEVHRFNLNDVTGARGESGVESNSEC